MSDKEKETDLNYEGLLNKIQSLEKRLNSIESMLRIEWVDKEKSKNANEKLEGGFTAEETESKIVEYGLAWLGSIIFSLGIIFLMSYIESSGYLISSKAIAYCSTFILIAFSYFSRNSFPILANVLNICSPLLLYYITVRLHFFSEQPLISQKGIAIFLLFVLIGIQLYNAIRKNSEFLGTIAITLCVTTAIFSDSTYITFVILTITALSALILFYQKVVF